MTNTFETLKYNWLRMGSQMKTAQMTRKELKYLERIRTMREKTSIFDDKFLPRGHRKKKRFLSGSISPHKRKLAIGNKWACNVKSF